MSTIIRQELQSDIPSTFEVNLKAFGQENEAKLVDALRKNRDIFIPELSIVAVKNNQVVGHILFTKIFIKNNNGNYCLSLALAPMAVIPKYQKIGIGGQLIKKGLEMARRLGYKSVIVLGHEHYYPKFGFKPAENWNIKAPFEVPSSVFMAIELTKDGLIQCAGTVIYPEEFQTVS